MSKYASKVVEQARSWLGKKESDGSHRSIIDIYNSHKPLARGYAVKYTDAWCATFVSAVSIKLGYTSIIPTECGCPEMIQKFKNIGSWDENDSRVPNSGDIIFYDWQDSGSGDNVGVADHVGIVEKVSGGTITVIEGNKNDSVCRRTIAVNARYIRGYGVPKYDAESEPVKKPASNSNEETKNVKATDSAGSFNKSFAGTYKVTASSLNIRHGAGTSKKVMVKIPKGTKVKCYGYYTELSSGKKWLYVQFTYKGITYTGFAYKKYLSK